MIPRTKLQLCCCAFLFRHPSDSNVTITQFFHFQLISATREPTCLLFCAPSPDHPPNHKGPQQLGRDARVRLPRQHSHFSTSRAAAQDHFRPHRHCCSSGQESENQTSGSAETTSFSSGQCYWSRSRKFIALAIHYWPPAEQSTASVERAAAYLPTCSARRRVRCNGNNLFLASFFVHC